MSDALRVNAGKTWTSIPAVLSCLFLCGCGASLNEGSHLTAATPGLTQTGYTRSDTTGAVSLDGREAKEVAELSATSNPTSVMYRIGPMDVIDVSVFQVPDLSKTVQVGADGTINLPLAGNIRAAGRTSGEIERDLTERLGRTYLQSPQVNVFIKEYNSQRVTVDGAVKRPGVYPLRGPSTLLQVIASAEGFTDTADPTVVIFRAGADTRTAAKFDVTQIRSGAAKDPEIIQGDVVVVSDSTMKESYQALLKILPVSSLFFSLL